MLKLSFPQLVYKYCALIPKGKVSTYQKIAIAIGKPKAARAIGNALNKNPYAPQVPCHRVIKTNGEIGGFASGSKNKIHLLEKEGIEIHNNKINLHKYLYEFKTKR